jgi:acetyl-CoA acetyltransferase
MAWISGVACTEFGRLPGLDALGWQSRAARAAIADAGLEPAQVDGLLAGYATTLRHLMPADLLAEYLGVKPTVAFGVSAGGATGLSMVATAAALVDSGSAHTVLVVGARIGPAAKARTPRSRHSPRSATVVTRFRWEPTCRPTTRCWHRTTCIVVASMPQAFHRLQCKCGGTRSPRRSAFHHTHLRVGRIVVSADRRSPASVGLLSHLRRWRRIRDH